MISIVMIIRRGDEIEVPKNKIDVKALKNIIIIYSAMKIMANLPLLYSVLNPETNSLSPSAKSKGVRFNSASTEISQRNKETWKILNQINFCMKIIE